MAPRAVSPELLESIAARFRALAEPTRLHIVHALRMGELSVSELVKATGLGQANVSKHLQLLLAAGFVRRRRDGLFARYALADQDVVQLCERMRGRMEAEG